jgi:hypothetical protein
MAAAAWKSEIQARVKEVEEWARRRTEEKKRSGDGKANQPQQW